MNKSDKRKNNGGFPDVPPAPNPPVPNRAHTEMKADCKKNKKEEKSDASEKEES